METRIIDRLFLELSQVTKAETSKEILLARQNHSISMQLSQAMKALEKVDGELERAKARIIALEHERGDVVSEDEAEDKGHM